MTARGIFYGGFTNRNALFDTRLFVVSSGDASIFAPLGTLRFRNMRFSINGLFSGSRRVTVAANDEARSLLCSRRAASVGCVGKLAIHRGAPSRRDASLHTAAQSWWANRLIIVVAPSRRVASYAA